MRNAPNGTLGMVLALFLATDMSLAAAANGTASNGQALLKALREADQSLAATLINMRTDVNARDETGATPLIWAAQRADTALVTQLLKVGADPNIRANNGLGPLQVAIANHAGDIALLLLKRGG